MASILFVPVVYEGNAGCLASIEEFGLQVGTPTRALSLYCLRVLLRDFCVTLPRRRDSCDATEAQLELAEAVNKFGFELMPDPTILGPALERVPHLEAPNGYQTLSAWHTILMVKVHSGPDGNNACRQLGGKCAFDAIVAARDFTV